MDQPFFISVLQPLSNSLNKVPAVKYNWIWNGGNQSQVFCHLALSLIHILFNILGTILGSILLAVISNGLTMVGASFFLKDIIQGAVLIFAVGFVAVIRHKR